MKSEITFTYSSSEPHLEKSFTSRVCWDSVKCIWFIGWIYRKGDYFNIFREPPYILTGKYIQELQAKFEDYIDNYLKEKDMKPKEEKEIPLFMQRNNTSKEEQNIKVTIIKDQDVTLVYQFIGALNKVANEMELLDEDEYSGTVLTVKLKRVYDEYKDRVMPSSSFESFIDYYSYLQTKKEEEKIEKARKDYFSKLSIIKKENEKKLNDLYEEYKEVLGLSLEDVKKQYKVI